MSHTAQMLDAHPVDLGAVDKQKLVSCIEACLDGTQAWTACAVPARAAKAAR